MKTKLLMTMLVIASVFCACNKEKKAGGCFRCQCNGYSDPSGDGKCETTRNDSPTKCGHLENEHK